MGNYRMMASFYGVSSVRLGQRSSPSRQGGSRWSLAARSLGQVGQRKKAGWSKRAWWKKVGQSCLWRSARLPLMCNGWSGLAADCASIEMFNKWWMLYDTPQRCSTITVLEDNASSGVVKWFSLRGRRRLLERRTRSALNLEHNTRFKYFIWLQVQLISDS